MPTVTLLDVVLGEGAPKIIVPLTGVDHAELLAQGSAVSGHGVDIVEWRLDWYSALDDVSALLASAAGLVDVLDGTPLLATFRTAAEGGQRHVPDTEYVKLYRTLCASGLVDAVDVELDVDRATGDAVMDAARATGVAVVMSNHDFGATPSKDEIVDRLARMQSRGADVLKVAYLPGSGSDVLALLGATWAFTSEQAERPVISMAMGGPGVVTRLAGEVFGSCATFATVGRSSAPGQVPLPDLAPVVRLIHDNLT